MALHLNTPPKSEKKFLFRYVFFYCNGFASSDPFSVVENPMNVTCKRCLKKIAAEKKGT